MRIPRQERARKMKPRKTPPLLVQRGKEDQNRRSMMMVAAGGGGGGGGSGNGDGDGGVRADGVGFGRSRRSGKGVRRGDGRESMLKYSGVKGQEEEGGGGKGDASENMKRLGKEAEENQEGEANFVSVAGWEEEREGERMDEFSSPWYAVDEMAGRLSTGGTVEERMGGVPPRGRSSGGGIKKIPSPGSVGWATEAGSRINDAKSRWWEAVEDDDFFGSLSSNGYGDSSGGLDPFGVVPPFEEFHLRGGGGVGRTSGGERGWGESGERGGGGGGARGGRFLLDRRSTLPKMKLDMDMAEECASWLKVEGSYIYVYIYIYIYYTPICSVYSIFYIIYSIFHIYNISNIKSLSYIIQYIYRCII